MLLENNAFFHCVRSLSHYLSMPGFIWGTCRLFWSFTAWNCCWLIFCWCSKISMASADRGPRPCKMKIERSIVKFLEKLYNHASCIKVGSENKISPGDAFCVKISVKNFVRPFCAKISMRNFV